MKIPKFLTWFRKQPNEPSKEPKQDLITFSLKDATFRVDYDITNIQPMAEMMALLLNEDGIIFIYGIMKEKHPEYAEALRGIYLANKKTADSKPLVSPLNVLKQQKTKY